jgi:glucose dehydrogenase
MTVSAPDRPRRLSLNTSITVTPLAQRVYGIIVIGFDFFLFTERGGISSARGPWFAVAIIARVDLVSLFPDVFTAFINVVARLAFHPVVYDMGLMVKFNQGL